MNMTLMASNTTDRIMKAASQTFHGMHFIKGETMAPKKSYSAYVDGAVEWAETHKSNVCKKCGITNLCTRAEIVGRDVVASFVCSCGHTTKYMTPESELRRTYNKGW